MGVSSFRNWSIVSMAGEKGASANDLVTVAIAVRAFSSHSSVVFEVVEWSPEVMNNNLMMGCDSAFGR